MSHPPPLLVAQITDTHLFADEAKSLLGLPTVLVLQTVLERLASLTPQPDLILLTGDLSQDETVESYQWLRSLLLPLGLPVYWVPGNHDQGNAIHQELSQEPLSAEKCFTACGWNFILLDSSVPANVHGHLWPDELAWLEQQLQAAEQPTVIALHHPPMAIGSAWMDSINLHNGDNFLAIIDRYPQVKAVLFGHIHQEFEQTRQGVRYLGAPSTCVQFQPDSANFAVHDIEPGFRLIQLHADGAIESWVERVTCGYQLDLAAAGY